jgi:hypothetical protein
MPPTVHIPSSIAAPPTAAGDTARHQSRSGNGSSSITIHSAMGTSTVAATIPPTATPSGLREDRGAERLDGEDRHERNDAAPRRPEERWHQLTREHRHADKRGNREQRLEPDAHSLASYIIWPRLARNILHDTGVSGVEDSRRSRAGA